MATRLLIINRDAEFSEQLILASEQFGAQVEVVRDGAEGIQLARLDTPSAVIITLHDDGGGYGLCSKLRRRVPNVPVLMLIEKAEVGSERLEKHQSLKTRATKYLTRPFTVKTYYDTLNEILDGALDDTHRSMSTTVGELDLLPGDSLLGASLFQPGELEAIEEEAEMAFDGLLSGDSGIAPIPDDVAALDLGIGIEADEAAPEPEPELALDAPEDEGLDDATEFGLPGNFAGPPPTPPGLDPEPSIEVDLDDDPDLSLEDLDDEPDLAMDSMADEEPLTFEQGTVDLEEEPDLVLEAAVSPIPEVAAPQIPEAPPAIADEPTPPPPKVASPRHSAKDEPSSFPRLPRLPTGAPEMPESVIQANEISQLKAALETARDQLRRQREMNRDTSARKELLATRQSLTEKEQLIVELHDKINQRDQELIAQSEEIDQMRSDNEELQADLRALDARRATLAAEMGDALGRAEAATSNIERLEKRTAELEAQVPELDENGLDAKDRELADRAAAIASLSAERDVLQRRVDDLMADVNARDGALTKLGTALDVAQAFLRRAQEEYTDYELSPETVRG